MSINPEGAADVPAAGTTNGAAEPPRAQRFAAWEKVPALVAVVRASDLTYEFANEAFCKATLFDAPPIGRPFGEDQAARSDFDFRALLRRIAETGEPFERSDVFVSLGAREDAWFDLSYQPMRDEHGAVTSILLFAIDVTSTHVARRDLEAHAESARRQRDALRASETRLRRVMGSSLMGILFWEEKGGITDCNDAFLAMLGYTRGELAEQGLRWTTLTPPEWRDADQNALREMRARGMCTPYEKEYLRKDGARLPVFLAAATFPDAPHEGVAFAIDLRDKKRDERRLIEARSILHTVVQSLPLTVFAVDTQARTRMAAGAAMRARGWRESDMLEKTARELFPGSPQAALHVDRALAGASFSTRDDFGPHGVFDSTFGPLRDSRGVVHGAFGLSIDVTERVRADEERAKLEEQMLRAQKLESLGLLAGGVAHDFNNLLTGMMANVSVARLDATGEAKDALDDALGAARHAASLARQLLAYAGRAPADVRRIDPSDRIGEIARLLATTLPKKVQLQLELANGLPPIEADVAQLQQVVMNLVINAAEAIGDAAGVVTVRTRAGTDGDVVLEVADTGCGMDAATRARIFDPFFTTKGTGRGLGLAAIQGIVRGHKGTIAIASEPRAGTTFTVTFPRAPGVAPKASDDAPAALQARGKVLVIDDEAAVRKAARRALERLGFEVVEGEDGRAGVRAFEANARDVAVVILDVTMPDLSGEETLALLRERGATVPVLLSSGYGELDPEARADVAGFLPKPYTSEELEAALARVLKR